MTMTLLSSGHVVGGLVIATNFLRSISVANVDWSISASGSAALRT